VTQTEDEFFFPQDPFQRTKEPVLISVCFLGIPCRWHGRRAPGREELLRRLAEKYVLVSVCLEQLDGMPTPGTSETLRGSAGAQVLDEGLRIIAPRTRQDVTQHCFDGANCARETAAIVGARIAYLKGGSPSRDTDDETGETLKRAGVRVVRIP